MATKNPDNVKTRKGKEGDTYYENTALAGRLKGKGINVKVGPVSSDRTQRKATNMAKRKEYASKRSSTPTKRTTSGGPWQATQPVRQVRNTTPTSDYLRSAPLAQTFAQNAPMQGDPRNVRGVNPGPMQQSGDPRNLRGVNPGTPQNYQT